MKHARALKPEISGIGTDGIPIRDERSPTLAAVLAGVARLAALTLPPREEAVLQELPCLMLGLVVGPQGFEPWTDAFDPGGRGGRCSFIRPMQGTDPALQAQGGVGLASTVTLL